MTAEQSTREKLLDSATKLWAVNGSHLVSLNVIVSDAGQRNASALQYHFGNREGLIDALFARHVPGIRAARQQILESGDVQNPRVVASALVLPLNALLKGDWRDRGFLCIAADLLGNSPKERFEKILSSSEADALNVFMVSHLPHLPPGLRRMRLRVAGMMVVHSLADLVRRHGIETEPPEADVFSSNLVDMYVASASAPVSESTRQEIEMTGAGYQRT